MGKVLIVDDVDQMRDLLKKIVSRLGKEAIEAVNGQEALEIAAKYHDIEIVLLDLGLPDMDGFKVARALKELHDSAKICIITGESEHDKIVTSRNLGITSYLIKPIKPSVVVERLQKLI